MLSQHRKLRRVWMIRNWDRDGVRRARGGDYIGARVCFESAARLRGEREPAKKFVWWNPWTW